MSILVMVQKDYTAPDGNFHKKGTLLMLPESVAAQLIRDGIATERRPPAPTERKCQ